MDDIRYANIYLLAFWGSGSLRFRREKNGWNTSFKGHYSTMNRGRKLTSFHDNLLIPIVEK